MPEKVIEGWDKFACLIFDGTIFTDLFTKDEETLFVKTWPAGVCNARIIYQIFEIARFVIIIISCKRLIHPELFIHGKYQQHQSHSTK